MSQKTLILTEKPSVARDFASALGHGQNKEGHIENNDYVITWAIGHLLTPFDPEDYDASYKRWALETLPIIPENFKFKSQSSTKKQLSVIKQLLKRPDISKVIVATDAGREGELIARLILNEAKSKHKSFRFFTSAALTKEVILEELSKSRPLEQFNRLYIAGSARQKADWLVGMNLSRLATLKMNDLFSVGRVQTAVLGLLVERKKQIENFVSKDYFEMKGSFEFSQGVVEAHWFDPKKSKDEDKKLDKRDFFDQLKNELLNKDAKISKLLETEKKQYPSGLYSLTDLQREANIKFGFSATTTLELAQSLYEKYKCLSYPRSDSKVMATSSFDMVKNLVTKFKNSHPDYFEKFVPNKVSLKNTILFNDAKLTDHHGLIPLKEFQGPVGSPEAKIYNLVLKRFITNFLEDFRYTETDLEINCQGHMFKTKGKKILELGFKVLEDSENEEILPPVNLHNQGTLRAANVEVKKTRPPFDYTEASLLYDMTNPARLVDETDLKKIFRTEIGLGTQATRAQIIETLLKRNYIIRSNKNIVSTDKGTHLINQLEKLPSTKTLTSVSQTAKLEIKLQSMAEGESDDHEFLNSIKDYVVNATTEWKTVLTQAIKVDRPAIANNKNTQVKFQKSELGKCPVCQADIMDYPKSYSCSKWKEGCKFTIWKEVAGKKLSTTQCKSLLSKKKTDLIKGFKSKSGKDFEAILQLTDEGKVEFIFPNRN